MFFLLVKLLCHSGKYIFRYPVQNIHIYSVIAARSVALMQEHPSFNSQQWNFCVKDSLFSLSMREFPLGTQTTSHSHKQ